MLVDINLLPKKPPKNIANHLILLTSALTLVFGSSYLYLQRATTRQEVEDLAFQTGLVEMNIQRLQNEVAALELHSDIETMQSIQEVASFTILTTHIIAEVRDHLPENASIVSYAYNTGDSLSFQLLVDQSPNVGQFVESLREVSWITQARVESVSLDARTDSWLGSVSITLNREELSNKAWRDVR